MSTASSAGAPEGAGSSARKAPAPAAWRRPAAADAGVGPHVMDAVSWPALPGAAAPPKSPAAMVSAASTSTVGDVVSPASVDNSGAASTNADRAAPALNPLEKDASGSQSSSSSVHVPLNNRRNGGTADHQNRRFVPHPQGRGGGGRGYGGGIRRGHGGIGNGGVGMRSGGRHGQDHHWGFNGHHHRGGGYKDWHQPGYWQPGPQLPYFRAPYHLAVSPGPPPPPPFSGAPAPQMHQFGHFGFPAMPHPPHYFAPTPLEGIHGLPYVPLSATTPVMMVPQEHPKEDSPETKLRKQIEYYFSLNNLCKDDFLRSKMDEHGWVPLTLIAGFNMVRKITDTLQTNNLQFIVDALQPSTMVEVQGGRMRSRTVRADYFPRPSCSSGSSSSTGSLSPVTSNVDALASQLQSVGLEGAAHHASRQEMPGKVAVSASSTLEINCNGSTPHTTPMPAKSLISS